MTELSLTMGATQHIGCCMDVDTDEKNRRYQRNTQRRPNGNTPYRNMSEESQMDTNQSKRKRKVKVTEKLIMDNIKDASNVNHDHTGNAIKIVSNMNMDIQINDTIDTGHKKGEQKYNVQDNTEKSAGVNVKTKTKNGQKDLAKMGRLRTKAIQELVSTESTYVDGLEKLIKYFIEPLKNSEDKKIRKLITIQDHQLIFPSDLATIYAFHQEFNSALIKATNEWNNKTSKIGDLFVEYGELFKLYQDYMLKYDNAIHHLHKLLHKNSKFNKWSLEQSKFTIGLTIESLLILPIQRLPRYEMLLKEIIKQTEEYHVDLYALKNAYDQVCEITEMINDKMTEYEKRLKASQIKKKFNEKDKDKMNKKFRDNPSRIFIEESKIEDDTIKHDKVGNRTNLVLFLFNDCIVYGIKTSSSNKALLTFGDAIQFGDDNLFDIDIVENDDSNTNYYQTRFCLKILSKNVSIWISFKDEEMRSKWTDLINQHNENYNEKAQNRHSMMLRHLSLNDDYSSNKDNGDREELYLPFPVFIPFDFSENCMDCNNAFSTFKRKKHHCNYCGKLCCNKCLDDNKCKNIWKSYFDGKEEMVKVCDECKSERDKYLFDLKERLAAINENDEDDNNLGVSKYQHPIADSNQSTFGLTLDHIQSSERHRKRRTTIDKQQRKRAESTTQNEHVIQEENSGFQD